VLLSFITHENYRARQLFHETLAFFSILGASFSLLLLLFVASDKYRRDEFPLAHDGEGTGDSGERILLP
jgi:hypothetical protein